MSESYLRRYYKTSAFYLEGLLRKPSNYHDTYVQLVQRYVGPGSLILDLGAGTGVSSQVLAQDFATIALDLSHLFLRAASPGHQAGLFRVAGDSLALPFRAGTLKLVGAFELIEHVWDAETMFEEIDRVLSPGGFVLIISPNMLSPVNAILTFLDEGRRGAIHLSRLAQACRNWYLTTRKLMVPSPFFAMQEVPERDDLHSDMDACYLASPVDLKKWFSRRGYQIRRYQRGGRTRLGRTANRLFGSYAPTIYFVAQKPSVHEPDLPRAEAL